MQRKETRSNRDRLELCETGREKRQWQGEDPEMEVGKGDPRQTLLIESFGKLCVKYSQNMSLFSSGTCLTLEYETPKEGRQGHLFGLGFERQRRRPSRFRSELYPLQTE